MGKVEARCKYSRTFTAGLRALASCAAALLLFAPNAQAQSYKNIPAKVTETQAKTMLRDVNTALRNPAGFGAEAPVVEQYFMQYYFPQMTQYSPADLAVLGEMRENLFRRFIRATPSAESAKTLTDWALKVGKAVSQGNYHPAVRYNASLILGNLDEQAAGAGAAPQPPVPLPAATAVMLELLEQNDFNGVAVHPSVKLGALVGLERHAQFGVSPQLADRVVQVALDVIAQENPPEEVSKSIHQWMKCRAASVLAWQGRQQPDARIISALNGLMTDDNLDLDNRTYIASLLSRMEFKQAADLDGPAALGAIATLSLAVMETEAKLADKYQEEMLDGGNVDFRSLRRGRMGDEDQGPTYNRRQLVSRLAGILDGGAVLVGALPEETQTQLKSLLSALEPARQTASDKGKGDLEIAKQVIASHQEVEQLVQGWNAGNAAAATDAEFSTVTAR